MISKTKLLALIAGFAISIGVQSGFAAGELVASSAKIPILSGHSKVGIHPSKVQIHPLVLENGGEVDDDELLGKAGGYFHPFISLSFEYTDNLYNLDNKFDSGETENLLTIVSPGIWFAIPRTKIIPITINPNNTSPGGLQQQFEDYRTFDRFQAYGLGGLDFKQYSEDSDLNRTDGQAEGMMRYNMPGGLGLQVVDRYAQDADQLDAGSLVRDQARGFDSNIFMAIADWNITEKVRTKFDYINFSLMYEDEINQYLDRVDNGADLYGFYNYSLKTSLFLEYKFIDAVYDESTLLDSKSHFFYGGIEWDTTIKTALFFKLGYQTKIFDDEILEEDDFEGIVYDLKLRYRYSEKTHMEFGSYRTNDAPDSFQASDQTVLGAVFKYDQQFSNRMSGSLDFTYEDIEYSNADIVVEGDRDDNTFAARPAVQYLFRDWLMFEVAYEYENRDSTDEFFSYDTNTFMFNANLSL